MRLPIVIAVAALVVGVIFGGVQVSQRRALERHAAELTGGEPVAGRKAMRRLGCIACHSIPGASATNPQSGPPLDDFATRTYVAGVAENTPDNLMRFIQDPRSVAPQSAMPKLHISDQDARDLAAFLYTMR